MTRNVPVSELRTVHAAPFGALMRARHLPVTSHRELTATTLAAEPSALELVTSASGGQPSATGRSLCRAWSIPPGRTPGPSASAWEPCSVTAPATAGSFLY